MSGILSKRDSMNRQIDVFKIMSGSKKVVDIRQNIEVDKIAKLKYIAKNPGARVRVKNIKGNESGFSFSGLQTNYDGVTLPEGYTRLEYIEANGSQWVNLEYNSNINIDVEICTQNTNPSKQSCIIAGRNTSADGFSVWTDGYFHFGKASALPPASTYITNENSHIYKVSKEGYYVDGNEIYGASDLGTNFVSSSPIYLFTAKKTGSGSGSVDNRMYEGKLFYCKIKDNGVLVRNLVPCLEVSSNKTGLYDLINSKFYSNSSDSTNFESGDYIVEQFNLPTNLSNFIANSFSETDGKILGNRKWYSEVTFDKNKVTCIQRWKKNASGGYEKLNSPITTVYNLDYILDVSLPLNQGNIALSTGESDIYAIVDIYKSVYKEPSILYGNLLNDEDTFIDKDGNELLIGYVNKN